MAANIAINYQFKCKIYQSFYIASSEIQKIAASIKHFIGS